MTHLTWLQILRLGLVQTALGSIVVLTTATMNRVMVVELALPAMLPGFLVVLYYCTQVSRPRFGHGADLGRRRMPWIIGGMVVLCLGGIGAALSVALMERSTIGGIAAGILAFLVIGFGIGASATNLLALLASRVAPERKAAAGSAVWIMMIAGLATTGIVAGQFLDPYSSARLIGVTCAVAAIALLLTIFAIWGIEGKPQSDQAETAKQPVLDALKDVWADPKARAFAIFVFSAMLAYNTQDLILEPYAGHVFAMTPGESTQLGGMHHGGALIGMLIVLLAGTLLRRWVEVPLRVWVVGGCLASGLALVALGIGGQQGTAWPIHLNILALGVSNGIFAVAAIGTMMVLASDGGGGREGTRMGVFGAAQAIAFGLGSLLGTALVDLMRSLLASDATAYGTVFMLEGALFLCSALLALRILVRERTQNSNLVPGE